MIYQILTIPNKILRERSDEVTNIDKNIIKTLDNMVETMYAAPGIGLAAIHHSTNPHISRTAPEPNSSTDRCSSSPESYEEVERPSKCKVRFLDKKGISRELECEGILATCIQHEIDHLDGKLFIDYLSRLKKSSIEKKFKKSNKRKN